MKCPQCGGEKTKNSTDSYGVEWEECVEGHRWQIDEPLLSAPLL